MTDGTASGKGAQLLERLPHRYPMRLVDAVLELRADYIKAVKNVTANEPFFPGHFPGMPVMPGVLIVEALAQASIVLAMNMSDVSSRQGLYLLVGVDNARFKRQVLPGDRLILESRRGRIKGNYCTFETVASVGGETAASAQLKSMFKEG